MIRALALAVSWRPRAHRHPAETLRMACTTSFENSGLAEILLPAIAAIPASRCSSSSSARGRR